ncbi:SNF2 domain containing protein [Klebsormidium nitens]|uniref:SNF2 domain containing protein n=1 Tax=Klebsormidium nitens TaxID=105231 RepID=A0A1Y1HPT1_KLENI|nr:SNF2 domain containing protein [Klebsormidium nitens]|eukprot:GAQ80644.1 SNF2 domain containing protein [Klebsormidium nitens]
MATAEEDAWWEGLPDQIEDWDAPLLPPIASQSTGRRKSSGEKASLKAILVKADRHQSGVSPPPQIVGVHGGGGGAKEQRSRIEANRIAALRRRNAATWYQAAHTSPGMLIPPFQQSVPCQVYPPAQVPPHLQPPLSEVPFPQMHLPGSTALPSHANVAHFGARLGALEERAMHESVPAACHRIGGTAKAAEYGGQEVNIEEVDASKTELRNGFKPEVGSEKLSDSPEFEVPEDFWDDVDEGQGRNSGGEGQTAADSSDVNRPLRDPGVIRRPLEVSLELHTVDLFRVSVHYAFCEPPSGSVFAPDPFENPEQRTRWGPAENAKTGSSSAKEEITKGDLLPGDPSEAQSPPPPIKRPCDSSWRPLKSWHIVNDEVDALMEQGLPSGLRKTLLPFQREGVRYSLRRGGRCLIADEMGVWKTIQGITIASCYRAEWPLLVVVPASMRLPWAEELERWLPFLGPRDVHLVFSFQNDLQEGAPCPKGIALSPSKCPIFGSKLRKVVVISYTMLRRLKRTFAAHKWGVLIVDESHNLRTTKNLKETEEKETVKEFLQKTKRAILLYGTPSLSRPFDIFHQADGLWTGLLGRNKYTFAKAYCDVRTLRRGCGNVVKDYSKGIRLHELHVLLAETIMVRRLKSDVLDQLPPKRRQVIRLKLEAGDIKDAKERTVQLAAELAAAGKVRGGKFARMEAEMLAGEESEEGGEEEEALRRLVEGGG